MENLVKKYQSLDFLKEKIGINYTIRDTDNTAFKYPTNNLNIQINYEEISAKFTRLDALKLSTDTANIEKILWQLYLLLYMERK